MKKHTTLSRTLLALTSGAMLLFAACSKNKDAVSPERVALDNTLAVTVADGDSATLTANGSQGKIYRDGDVYRVAAFRQAYSSGPGQPADGNFYWDFPNNDAGTALAYSIKFSGIATGDISAGASTEIRYIDIDFEDVIASDWSSATPPQPSTYTSDVIGMNSVFATPPNTVPSSVSGYANGHGWYIYNWDNHTVSPVNGRTLLWSDGTDTYAFKITSIYQWGGVGGSFPYYHFLYRKL